jgi:peptidoglycan/xylan/chitin deacetylase (PgdA/CDA1 family)
MLRDLVKTGLAFGLDKTGAAALLGAASRSRRTPLILGYHRVVQDFQESSRRSIPSMLISARMLERHLDYLGRHYRFVSLDEIGQCLLEGRSTARLAAITFDDGYRDVYENALPILKRRDIPAAVFVVTEMIGTAKRLIHDRLYSLLSRALSTAKNGAEELSRVHRDCHLDEPGARKLARASRSTFAAMRLFLDALPQRQVLAVIKALEERFEVEEDHEELPLSWSMVEEMRRSGITIGSHSKRHVLLTHETDRRRGEEMSGSRRFLEARLGAPIEHFAYPDGRFDVPTVVAAAGAGYRFAYTTCGHRVADYPLLTLPRRFFWEKSCTDALGSFSEAVLACHVIGAFDVMSPCPLAHGSGTNGLRRRAAWNGSSS